MSTKEAVSLTGLLAVLFLPAAAGIGAGHLLVSLAAWFEPILAGWLR